MALSASLGIILKRWIVAGLVVTLFAVTSLAIAPRACAQNSAPPEAKSAGNTEFEVVSVRPNRSGNPGANFGAPRGQRFTFINVTLQMLMTVGYHVQNFQISGGPDWLNSERYDIVAKFEDPAATVEQQLQMIRTMLEKRFQLSVRRETKEMPVYELVKSRADITGGPGLRQSSDEPCPATAPAPGTPPAAGELPKSVCGQIIFGRNQLNGEKVPVARIAAVLSTIVGRTVIDGTGLPGRFDLKMEWTPDELLPERGQDQNAQQANAAGPSIFTAIREQLGLRLNSQKGPVEVLIVEHAERLSDDAN